LEICLPEGEVVVHLFGDPLLVLSGARDSKLNLVIGERSVAEPIESWGVRVKPREYQRNIPLSACKQNWTLVVLPTGLGKTIIAMLVADLRLRQPVSQGETNKND
jgi:hypothetical protein